MIHSSESQRQTLLAELDLHKTEFQALREEILNLIDAERQALNLTLVATGAGFGLMPYLLGQDAFIILLLFPLVFHVLLWEMMNSVRMLSRIAAYLTSTLIPRVNTILDELGSKRNDTKAFGWEVHFASMAMSKGELIMTALTPTRHWMPILAIAALLIAYGLIVNDRNHVPTSGEFWLLLINLALLIWAAVRNTVTVGNYMERTHSLRKQDNQENARENVPQEGIDNKDGSSLIQEENRENSTEERAASSAAEDS